MSTWLLLRGLTRETRHWGNFAEVLRKYVPDASVIAVDLPGNGTLHDIESPTRVEEMAVQCRAQLGRLAIVGPYNIIAMSLGGMVAAAWAAQHPREIARCVLINTSMRPFSAFHERLRARNYGGLLKLMLTGADEEAWEKAILAMTSNQAEAHSSVIKKWVAYRKEFPVTSENALRQLKAAARYRAPATKPAADMLVLTSEKDGLVDTRCSEALAAAWGVPIAKHPSAGHDLPLDDAPWVAKQIAAWLRSAESAAR